jgi:phage-related protein
MGINYFKYAGRMSTDFGVWISGEATYQSPEKDIEIVTVPGRNGSLSFDNNRFQNINIPYDAYIIDDFEKNFDAFKAFLGSVKGYARLSDTYHPDFYRMARFYSAIEPEMTQLNRHGKFTINFDCDPRRFLKSGEKKRDLVASIALKNPTSFDALPMMRVYGTGTVTIGSIAVTINEADVYTDIDCDTQDAYKGNVNCNNKITLTAGKFPVLKPGINNIYLSGVSKVELTPRWWTI